MAEARPLPPIWLMGLGYLPLGVFGAVMLIVVPQLLAANHVPEQQIAGVTSVALIPGFTASCSRRCWTGASAAGPMP